MSDILIKAILHYRNQRLVEGRVLQVGRKYVTVAPAEGNGRELKFNIQSLYEVLDINYRGKLYLTKQTYEDEIRLEQL